MTSKPTICRICDDKGANWELRDNWGPVPGETYHKACLEYRATHPNNDRERRATLNTLSFGYAIRDA